MKIEKREKTQFLLGKYPTMTGDNKIFGILRKHLVLKTHKYTNLWNIKTIEMRKRIKSQLLLTNYILVKSLIYLIWSYSYTLLYFYG